MNRRRVLLAALGTTAAGLPAGRLLAATDRDITFAQDFDEFWTTLRDRYCFFSEKQTDWEQVRRVYRPLAVEAASRDDFAAIVAEAAFELYDPHTGVSDMPPGTPRGAISDVLVAYAAGEARVVALQDGGAAASQGLMRNDIIEAVNGVSIADAVQSRMPRCLTNADDHAVAFAAGRAVAGTRGEPRRYRVKRTGGKRIDLVIPTTPRSSSSDVEWRRLEDGIGLITIRSFANDAVVEAFNAALVELRNCPALILDVRGNGGGDTAVARPIMGRFIRKAAPYAMMRRRAGEGLSEPWVETVDPEGPFTFDGPVAVVVDRWSGSMAEGFPMGMKSLGRGVIVGSPMMGLGAAVFPLRLDRTGIDAQYSAEPVYDAQGNPRWHLRPDIEALDGQDPFILAQQFLWGSR